MAEFKRYLIFSRAKKKLCNTNHVVLEKLGLLYGRWLLMKICVVVLYPRPPLPTTLC